MSKVIFNNQDGQNYITLVKRNDGAVTANGTSVAFSGTLGDNNVSIPTYMDAVEVQNNNHLTVADSSIHLSAITATSGTINLHNSYVGHEPTDITVGSNSTVNITGSDICIGTLILDQNSTLNFTHNNHNYHIQTPIDIIGDNALIQIQDMDKCLITREFINDKLVTKTPFALDEICYLRDYEQLDHNFVNLFVEQNGMVGTEVIDKFIAKNYMLCTTVAKDNNLPGSFLQGAGPYDVLGEICSWLDLSDVVLTDEPGDLDILIGNSNLNQCLFD